jgi:PAS domain S-box-containing protein
MANLGHAVWDEVNEKYSLVSDGWAGIHGYNKEEFMARFQYVEADIELIHPADRDRYKAFSVEWKDREDIPDIEYRILRRDGKVRHILDSHNYIRGGPGNWARSLMTIQDITDRVMRENELTKSRKEEAARAAKLERLNAVLIQIQEQLRTTQQQAKSANEAKSVFLATMSHEIRSPLHVILTMNTLLKESNLTPEQREFINLSRDSGQTLMALINDILDFSKIESGKLKMNYEWFNPVKTVKHIAEQLYGRAALKGIEVVSVISPLVPKVCLGDEIRLRQILINLVTNAIKFTESGGVIIRLLSSGKDIEIQIDDSGIGIAADRHETIFDEFVQVNEGNSRGIGGSGLGLSIVRRLVELMKGEVILDSAESKGSNFRVLLPMKTKGPVDFTPLDSGHHVCLDIANPVLAQGLREQISMMGAHTYLLEDFLSEAPSGTNKCVLLVDHNKDGRTAKDHRSRIDKLRDAGNWGVATLVDMREVGYVKQAIEDGYDAAIRKPLQADDVQEHLFGSAHHAVDDVVVARQDTSGDSSVGEGKLVLLVEDSPSIQAMTRALLERKGYDVATANNGGNAVAKAAARPFDVILMDIAMPIMDGLTATRHIRGGNGPNQQTPIIAMTANAFNEDRERCFAAGMDEFISKPVDVEKFYQLLEHWTSSEAPTAAQSAAVESTDEKPEIGLLAPEILETLAENVSWDLLPNIVDTFVGETKQRVALAMELFSRSDLDSLMDQAHTIKSGAGSFGLMKLQTLAAKIELAAKKEDLDSVTKAMTGLENLAHESTSALKNFLKKHGGTSF